MSKDSLSLLSFSNQGELPQEHPVQTTPPSLCYSDARAVSWQSELWESVWWHMSRPERVVDGHPSEVKVAQVFFHDHLAEFVTENTADASAANQRAGHSGAGLVHIRTDFLLRCRATSDFLKPSRLYSLLARRFAACRSALVPLASPSSLPPSSRCSACGYSSSVGRFTGRSLMRTVWIVRCACVCVRVCAITPCFYGYSATSIQTQQNVTR